VTVSVVIAAYNAAATLRETLESMRAQTFADWEAIVIDDGSADGTAAIANEFADGDRRFSVVSQANAGESGARNSGVARASGDWLLFLDADDWIAPHHLQRMTAALAADPTLDAVHCLSVRVAADGSHVVDPYQPPAGDMFATLAKRAAFPVHACVVRRRLVDEVGRFDTSLKKSPDWDLWQRVARTGAKFGAVREVLAFYRMQPQSASLAAEQLFRDGLTVMRRGHAADPRVASPAPAHANGEPPDELRSQEFYLLSWCAGLLIGQGGTGVDLLSILPDEPARIYANAIAQIIFEAAPMPACRNRREWETLWQDFGPRAETFLAALEARAHVPNLAADSRRLLRRLIVRASAAWGDVVEALEAEVAASEARRRAEVARAEGERDTMRQERDAVATERWTLEKELWVRIGRRAGLVKNPPLPEPKA
jgi:glycosyltransferase involved in cell wall biosynthesis